MVKRRWSWTMLISLTAFAGCAIGREGPSGSPVEAERPDYGPNRVAECLRWPKDAPHFEPLYAP